MSTRTVTLSTSTSTSTPGRTAALMIRDVTETIGNSICTVRISWIPVTASPGAATSYGSMTPAPGQYSTYYVTGADGSSTLFTSSIGAQYTTYTTTGSDGAVYTVTAQRPGSLTTVLSTDSTGGVHTSVSTLPASASNPSLTTSTVTASSTSSAPVSVT